MTVFILFFVKKALLGLIVEVGLTIYCIKQRRWLLWIIATYFIAIHCLLILFPLTLYVVYASDYLLVSVLFFKYSNLTDGKKSLLILLDIFLFLWLSCYVLFSPIVSNTYRFTEFKEKGQEYVVVQMITEYSHFAQESTTVNGYVYKNSFFTPSDTVLHKSRIAGEYATIPALLKNLKELATYLNSNEQ
ncbi:hypothetical protein IGI39_003645 [Enterococcus sp. AZ135]